MPNEQESQRIALGEVTFTKASNTRYFYPAETGPRVTDLSGRRHDSAQCSLVETRTLGELLPRRLSRRHPCEWPCPCAKADSSVAWPWHRCRNSAASLCRHDKHTCWSKGHERIVQVDVDLTEQRMQPVIHRTHGIGQVEIVPVGSGHLRLYV